MSQYRVGTVAVVNGSPVVTAVDPDPSDGLVSPQQQWSTEALVGYFFVVSGDNVLYTIQSVDSDTQLTLTQNFAGASTIVSPVPQEGDLYALVRDFSQNFGFPLVSPGDIATASVVEKAMRMIDAEFVTFNTLVGGGTPATPPAPPPLPPSQPPVDSEPPTVPANVFATVVSDTEIDLDWDASSDLGGGSVAGYRVFRNGLLVDTVTAGTSHSSTDLDGSTQYSFTVSAYDDSVPANVSEESAPVLATTLDAPDLTAPTIPTNLATTVTGLLEASLTWTGSTDLGGGTVLGYNIYREDIGLLDSVLAPLTAYIDDTVVEDSTYTYTVSAYDTSNPANESLPSDPSQITITAPDVDGAYRGYPLNRFRGLR